MSLDASTSLSSINQKRPDNLLIQLGKMKSEIEAMYALIAAESNGIETDISTHTANTSNPHSVTKTQVGLGNVDNYATASQAQMEAGSASDKFATPLGTKQAIDKQIKGTSWTMENGLYIATDEIRARDSGGLALGDDAGQGPKVNDGGIVTNAYQPGFRAYVTSTQSNVTGDSTIYNLNTSIWSEISDVGNNFSAGVFTAPIASNKYYFNVNMFLQGITTSHTEILIALIVSGGAGQLRGAKTHGNAASVGGDIVLSMHFNNVTMSASDTAYIFLRAAGSTKTVNVGATYTTFSGGLMI